MVVHTIRMHHMSGRSYAVCVVDNEDLGPKVLCTLQS